jgi:hypothetical protein
MSDLYQLPSVTFTAGGNATVNLKDLPVARRGRIPHVKRFIIEADLTPTYTTAPTTVGNNAMVSRCDFWDGKINRLTGGFNLIRAHERMHTGMVRIPDPDTNIASTSTRFLRRVLHVGPPQGIVGINDFMIATGALQSAELRLVFGALTDISADTTVATGTIRVFADLEIADEVRVPPAYKVETVSMGQADQQIQGRSLLVAAWLHKNTSFGAFSSGDIGNVTLDLGLGPVIQAIRATALTAQYQDDFGAGELGTFVGDFRGATDSNGRAINHASTTAITTQPQDLQPLYWLKPRGKLSKQEVAETAMRLSWDGSATSAVLAIARILPQSPTVAASYAQNAFTAIGRRMGPVRIKTASKRDYQGPRADFMPWSVKVA